MGQMGPEQSTARRGYVKVLMGMHGSNLFFWYLCFFLWAYLQFGPFLDAKHEQVEVSDGLGWGDRGDLHLDETSLLLTSLEVYFATNPCG